MADELLGGDVGAGPADDDGLALPLEGEVDPGLDEAVVEEAPAAESMVTLTVDDIPELAEFQIGDQVTLQVSHIAEDGKFSLNFVPAAIEEELPAATGEGLPAEGPVAGGGQGAVLDELSV